MKLQNAIQDSFVCRTYFPKVFHVNYHYLTNIIYSTKMGEINISL